MNEKTQIGLALVLSASLLACETAAPPEAADSSSPSSPAAEAPPGTAEAATAKPTTAKPTTAKPPVARPSSLGTADQLKTRIGTLELLDGAPTAETATRVYEAMDFTRALNAYNNSFRGASAYAIRQGFQSIGAKDGDVIVFSELMDAIPVPDGQRGYRVLLGKPRSDEGPHGHRAAATGPRHDQRHVVFLDHRHRLPWARPRTRWKITDRSARI